MGCSSQKKITQTKIVCHTCDGEGRIEEEEFPSKKKVMVICPECDGEGWVWAERFKWFEEEK